MKTGGAFAITYLYLISQQGDHRFIKCIEFCGPIESIASQCEIGLKLNCRLGHPNHEKPTDLSGPNKCTSVGNASALLEDMCFAMTAALCATGIPARDMGIRVLEMVLANIR